MHCTRQGCYLILDTLNLNAPYSIVSLHVYTDKHVLYVIINAWRIKLLTYSSYHMMSTILPSHSKTHMAIHIVLLHYRHDMRLNRGGLRLFECVLLLLLWGTISCTIIPCKIPSRPHYYYYHYFLQNKGSKERKKKRKKEQRGYWMSIIVIMWLLTNDTHNQPPSLSLTGGKGKMQYIVSLLRDLQTLRVAILSTSGMLD